MLVYKVTFQPEGKTIEVEEGVNLLEAAEKAGVLINSLCGGQGVCGECRLRILKGNAHADKYALSLFSAEELKAGYVLACQTKVTSDLEVLVPEKARVESAKILTDGVQVTYSEPVHVNLPETHEAASLFQPLVIKVFLDLPVPTITDNISDVDRIIRELQKKFAYKNYEITLNCLRKVAETLRNNDWKVTVTLAQGNSTGKIINIEGGNTTSRNYGIAVDVGTTTVVVQLVDLRTGKILGVEGNHNLQAHYGADVISRMVFACGRGSLEVLREAVVKNINNLIDALSADTGVNRFDITCMVAAGNTVMSHFLLGLTPCAIRLEPYVPTTMVYPQLLARDLGVMINHEAVVEIMPSVSSYVGGDIVAGVLACGLADRTEVSCLIDVGTNGEIVIGNNEWMVCCSASAGPAFEGGGMKWGMRATRGAIEKVSINNGRLEYRTVAGGKPRGICGSGFIDIIYELLRNGIIGPDGKFHHLNHDPRFFINDEGPQYILAYPEETESGEVITITETDIANLIKSKGAVFAAIKSLADYIGITFDQFSMIYLAGGFGSSLDIAKAIAIGLLPDIDKTKIQYIGNSSLTGARMSLLSASTFEKSVGISRRMTNIELSAYPPFMNEFIAALFLPHTDGKLFPNVKF